MSNRNADIRDLLSPVDRTSDATDKLKTWDEKFAEEFLTQERTNEAITDARIDAYEQYAKGSVGACRQDIAELVAEVRRLRAEPRTDYAPGEREALLALVHAARWVLTRHYNEHHESMRELKKMISNFDATQKRSDP